MAESVEALNEAELMRTCGHLYVSIALESFATTLMCCAFAYLLLLITNRGRLEKPGTAACVFVKTQLWSMYNELASEVRHWTKMPRLPLERRFALCRKCNQAICTFQLAIGVLTIERWLHINNINGFRYLGYSATCPPMQTELVILIAPVIPCYKLQCTTTFISTMLMLWFGYGASVIPGPLYTGSLEAFVSSWDLDELKPNRKFYLTMGAVAVQFYLSFIQIPYLALTYICRRRSQAAQALNLPHGYLKLLFIVAITWLAFPAWWAVSFEGMSVLTDTKLNAVGFALLNVISKGSFTLQMLSMVKRFKVQKKREEAIRAGRRPSLDQTPVGLFEPDAAEEEAAQPVQVTSVPSANDRRLKRSETWLVRILRPYDDGADAPSGWVELEATYRAFLVGHGVTPTTWEQMSPENRGQMKEDYEGSLDLVVYDSQGQARERDEVTSSGSYTAQPGIRKGQTLTSVHGDKGRVLDVLEHEVQLSVPGKQPVLVSISDLTVVKVSFLGARGLRAADSTGKLQLYCSCMIFGKPSSEVQTKAEMPGESKVNWDHEVSLYGYCSGDPFAIRLWGKDPTLKSHELLGEVILKAAEISNRTYEGELQLETSKEKIGTYLSVIIMTENLSVDGGSQLVTMEEETADRVNL